MDNNDILIKKLRNFWNDDGKYENNTKKMEKKNDKVFGLFD